MRNLRTLDYCRDGSARVMEHYGSIGDATCGVFRVKVRGGPQLRIVASSDDGWEHVSVSLEHRCPTWEEMAYVKSLFFTDEETVMQLHVPVATHINEHNYCLHLWRPTDVEIPRPPGWMVA